jgi:hypothetical protein
MDMYHYNNNKQDNNNCQIQRRKYMAKCCSNNRNSNSCTRTTQQSIIVSDMMMDQPTKSKGMLGTNTLPINHPIVVQYLCKQKEEETNGLGNTCSNISYRNNTLELILVPP